MAQVLAPDTSSNATNLSYSTGSTAHLLVDDSPPGSTGDFFYSTGAGSVALGIADPAAGTPTNGTSDCTLSWTAVRIGSGALSTDGSGSPTVTVTVRESGSTRATKTTTLSSGASSVQDSLTFSSSSITSWANVDVLVELADSGGGPNNRDGGLANISLSVPDVPVAAAYDQEAFRFYNDDGSLAASTPKDAQGADVSMGNQVVRVRIRVKQTAATSSSDSLNAQLYYSRNSGAYAAVADAGAGGSPLVRMYDSTQFAHNDSVSTERLTGGSGTWFNGYAYDTSNGGTDPSYAAGANRYTELEFCVQLVGMSVSDTIDLRVYNGDPNPIGTYTDTPRITVAGQNYNETEGPETATATDAWVSRDLAKVMPQVTFTDNFNRADSADPGSSYADATGSANNFRILSNAAAGLAVQGDTWTEFVDVGAVQDFAMTFTHVTGHVAASSVEASFQFRTQGSNPFSGASLSCYDLWQEAGYLRLGRYASGSRTQLGEHYVGTFDNHKVTLVARGSSLRAYLNGALVIDVTDGTYTAGRLLVYTWASSTVYPVFDDFELIDLLKADAALASDSLSYLRVLERAAGPDTAAATDSLAYVKSLGSSPQDTAAATDSLQYSLGGPITLYSTKPGTLTASEVDGNFTWLNTAKLEVSVGSAASESPVAPDGSKSVYRVTALAADVSVSAPSGTPADGQCITVEISDDGTSRTLTWNAAYRAVGATLPPSTVPGSVARVFAVYNSQDSKWDVLGAHQ